MPAFELPADLARSRILISNDDGIHSPGLAALERIARTLSDDVWVVAPETEQSAAGHSLTLQRPLRVRRIDERHFAIDGTPTDCALMAINHLVPERRPDLVLSGINLGRNICEDVTYSGTIAVAMEATLLGVPAIAFSQDTADGRFDWATAEHWGPGLIRQLITCPWERSVLISVNFPDCAPDRVTGVRVARHGKRKVSDELVVREDPRGRTYYWIGLLQGAEDVSPDTDLGALSQNAISITPLDLDLTHQPTLESLRRLFP